MAENITDKDKLMHFGVCLVSAIIHPMLSVGLAFGKEYGDSNAQGNHWCWMDLLADGAGCAVGSVVWWFWSYYL